MLMTIECWALEIREASSGCSSSRGEKKLRWSAG
jgi:hypothetical protein